VEDESGRDAHLNQNVKGVMDDVRLGRTELLQKIEISMTIGPEPYYFAMDYGS
jgi:hypothetical protein